MTLKSIFTCIFFIPDVNGVRVTPVRKAAMPANINTFASWGTKLNQPDKTEPMPAPALNDGANTPPEAPVVKQKIGPAIRKIALHHDENF